VNEPSAPRQISAEYKGMIFRDLVRLRGIPIEGTATYGNKRVVFRGEFKIVETGGSWRWGPQLQLKLWNCEVTEEDSVNPESLEKWGGRMEIYLPLEKGLDVILAAYRKIMEE